MKMKQKLHEAMQYLSSVCDGAVSTDGAGFTKGDGYNGAYIASVPVEQWNSDMFVTAYGYAKKYRKQIAHIVSPDDISEYSEYVSSLTDYNPLNVTEARRKAYYTGNKKRELTYEDGKLVVNTPYDAGFVVDSKAIKSRKYAGTTFTTFHPSDLDKVLELCAKYDVEVLLDVEEVRKTLSKEVVAEGPVKSNDEHLKSVTLNGNTLEIRFPFDRDTVALVKSTQVARWNPDSKMWTAPLSALLTLKTVLKDFIFSEETSEVTAILDSNKASYNIEGTDYRVEVPGLKPEFSLLSHQWVPVEKALKNRKLLIADSQGLGKTLSALATMRIGKTKRAIVIAPAPLLLNWMKEASMFFEEGAFTVFLAEGQTPSDIPEDANLVLVGWPNINFWEEALKDYAAEVLVVDEAHYGKSGKKSKRGDSYIALGKHYRKAVKIALTGTPILNRPLELLAALQFLGLEKEFGGITKFKNRYCGPQQVETPYGVTFTYKGATNIPELHDILVSTGSYLRRTKKMLIDQGLLKRKYVNGVEFFDYNSKRTPTFIHLNPEEQQVYAQIDADFRSNLEAEQRKVARGMGLPTNHPHVKNIIASNKGGSSITLLTEMRKRIGLLKVRAISEYIEQRVQAGERVVVFAHHREVVDAYAERFGGLKIQGGMGAKKIEDVKTKFNGLPIEQAPVLSVSIEAGKTGHTLCLQEKNGVGPSCATAVFAEEPYVYGDYEQAEDRIYRIGQTRNVYIHNLMVEGTVDEVIYNIRESKRAVFNAVIDGVSLEDDNDDTVAQQVLKSLM